jgi:superfamily II DNA/RNA helicase
MHLIRETLGCYDSHYETFLDTLESEINGGKKRLKVIGASATISEPESQLYHLYMKSGSIFPCRGPDRKESFYYLERQDAVSRYIIGVLPHSKTIIHAIQDILLYHALMVRIWEGDPDRLVSGGFFASREEAAAALSNYSVAVSYNTMKMQVDAIASAARKILSPQLRDWGLRGIKVQPLTGDVSFERVKMVLELLERKEGPRDVDLITATSMISHGVDIDALNFMVFMGVPTSTAEYVQAYSRVGRSHPGVVVVVVNHARERDTSHYRYFSNYHNLSDLLVEPVPINRWAKNSIERTLPGIFCASVMAYFEPQVQKAKGVKRRLYMSDGFTDSINDRSLKEEDILEFVRKCYHVEDPMGSQFDEAIRSGVHRYVNELTCPRKGSFISGVISTPPLISLRDTDVQVDVKTNAESFAPMGMVSAASKGVADQ